MKKKSFKSLILNKKSISKFSNEEIIGGTNGQTDVNECPSVRVKPHCMSHESYITVCECESDRC
ncbi:hypothetical protein IMCC3317_22400 [Kordia antarctica]|uniref:Uncharacterized protein n=1 Tax=Kordia antarctica TaxID=1218801 RepID=A0A7L4ZK13_9FLAO|nr:hypothetical protein [Kordia antarctica]QHI36870.1 hypothetical protein IMCC3317_22400 [Kordia antarctica]